LEIRKYIVIFTDEYLFIKKKIMISGKALKLVSITLEEFEQLVGARLIGEVLCHGDDL
jgi:hypothetical protein